MKQYISYEKLSKKKKRELDRQSRQIWGFDPTTRQRQSKKCYDRKKARRSYDEDAPFLYLFWLAAQRNRNGRRVSPCRCFRPCRSFSYQATLR